MPDRNAELPLFPAVEGSARTPALKTHADPMPHQVYCGIAGWSYPDWDGYVYPPGTRDKLGFISRYVDMIEINSSFYRPPNARTTISWVRKTEDLPGFFFTAKLNKAITHDGIIEESMVKAFHSGFEPLVKAGRLRQLLAQFKYDFADSPEHRNHIAKIVSDFSDMAGIVLELRHRSWQDSECLNHLSSLGVTVANLDYPTTHNSFDLHLCSVGEHAYLRLHGRNAKAWFARKSGRDETYNYCYSDNELGEIRERATNIARMSKTLTVVANNHYQGKEVANCLQLKSMLSGRKVRVPEQLAGKYPQLRQVSADRE